MSRVSPIVSFIGTIALFFITLEFCAAFQYGESLMHPALCAVAVLCLMALPRYIVSIGNAIDKIDEQGDHWRLA